MPAKYWHVTDLFLRNCRIKLVEAKQLLIKTRNIKKLNPMHFYNDCSHLPLRRTVSDPNLSVHEQTEKLDQLIIDTKKEQYKKFRAYVTNQIGAAKKNYISRSFSESNKSFHSWLKWKSQRQPSSICFLREIYLYSFSWLLLFD